MPDPWLEDPDVVLYHGDCLAVLRELPPRSVHMCATSPPFYGLRDYGTEGQIGLEDTPDQWVERLVAVFREVRRVLRDDGTLWVEIGDSYANGSIGRNDADRNFTGGGGNKLGTGNPGGGIARSVPGHKVKDLLGQPWLLAFALRADGWYLRAEIIWARPNPMPESVTDRPTKSHSTVFLLSKRPRYFYDADAIREDIKETSGLRQAPSKHESNLRGGVNGYVQRDVPTFDHVAGANARSVWQIATEPTPFAHFATWPQALVRRMILAGTSERGCCPECGAPWVREVERVAAPDEVRTNTIVPEQDVELVNRGFRKDGVRRGSGQKYQNWLNENPPQTLGWSPSCACDHTPVPAVVLDPFAGSGTTCLVARNHGRHSIGIELNAAYLRIAGKRLQQLSLLAGAPDA